MGQEFFLDLREVINFAIEGDGKFARRAAHGLAAAGQINDGEPPVPQAYGAVQPEAGTVGAPVGQSVGHGPHPWPGFLRQGAAVRLAEARYAAHDCRHFW